MNFRPAKLEDFEFMAEHSTNKGIHNKRVDRIDYDYTLEHDGNLLGMGGFSMIIPTTFWCWVDFTKTGEDHLLTAYRVIKEWIDNFAEDMAITRLQAFVRNNERHIRLVNHLGFIREGNMEKFYGTEDALLYKRIF